MLFADIVKPTKMHMVLPLTTIDISNCRKANRENPGENMILSEHFRYDIVNGISVPNVLVKAIRTNISTNVMEPVPPIDATVCKRETQIARHDRRDAFLRQMQSACDVSVVDQYRVSLDSSFDYSDIVPSNFIFLRM